VIHALFVATVLSAVSVSLGAMIGGQWLLRVPPIAAVVTIVRLALQNSQWLTASMVLALAVFALVAYMSLSAGIALRRRFARHVPARP
jgi:hypothetical protein